MNRIIKFRALRADENRWVYGHYFQAPLTIENFGCRFLSTPDQKKLDCIESDGVVYSIKKETLGQFTGLLDKNNKEVYEGDIIEYFHWCYANSDKRILNEIEWQHEDWNNRVTQDIYYPLISEVKWNNIYSTYEPLIFAQEDYNGNCFGNVCVSRENYLLNSKGLSNYPPSYFEVLGNIHDNPELLNK